ncbi:MAG TPA: hypothetical protein PLB91_07130 [Spirochaetales bacterium]|nr:hypothetical protein [Spirochaetales bacterium]HRY53363.1 hypothetical protein [Spirochaetia bacterium]HRZ65245.1 hypothetical protein [Spirochaetia bacterium]
MKHDIRRPAPRGALLRAAWLAAILAAIPPALPAEAKSSALAVFGTESGAAFETSAWGSAEALGKSLAARLSGGATASIGLPGAESSGEAGLSAELSASGGRTVALLRVDGGIADGAAFDAEAGSVGTFGAEILLTLNGPRCSFSLSPRLERRSGDEGRTEYGGGIGASASAGGFVLKPKADASWTEWDDGGESLQLLPSFGLSWYPGFPLSLSADAGFRRSWLSSGEVLDELPCGISCYGAAGDRLFFSLDAYALIDLEDGDFSEAGVAGELSLMLRRLSRGELRLPIGLSWDSEGPEGWDGIAIRLGLELLLD